MRLFAQALCGLLLGSIAAPVVAQSSSGVVVELYTSQGCSSCPPADAYLAELAQDHGVIALALHVDYWDYIGWKDSFANGKFTDRQKDYALAGGSSTIYTPQMIVGGMDRVEGSNPEKVEGSIRRQQSAQPMVVLQLMRSGDQVVIHATAQTALSGPLVVQLVRYRPTETVTIKHGENAGRTITYTNIVTSWARIAEWPGTDDLDLSLPLLGADPVVVIVQQPGPGMILAASVLR